MIYNLILNLVLIDSFFPALSFIRGYYYGRYAIVKNLNRMYILDKYIKNSIFGLKKKLPLINHGFIFSILFSVPYMFIQTSYFRNDDANIYYLNNINKYYDSNKCLLSWSKLGFNVGQLIYYNKTS